MTEFHLEQKSVLRRTKYSFHLLSNVTGRLLLHELPGAAVVALHLDHGGHADLVNLNGIFKHPNEKPANTGLMNDDNNDHLVWIGR